MAMSSFGSDFDEIRREADARRFGAALYLEAASISPEAVEYVAAVLTSVSRSGGGDGSGGCRRVWHPQTVARVP